MQATAFSLRRRRLAFSFCRNLFSVGSDSGIPLTTCRTNYFKRYSLSTLRRPRRYVGKHKEAGNTPFFGRLEEPYEHGEGNINDYLDKATLSPWAPLPDSAARKIFDLAGAKPSDIHVDLGSGDGRVNFHAIDYGILKTTGIDVDEKIIEVARERLAKRHPPPDLEFIVADLLDEHSPAWAVVQQATIISMYFADKALDVFRPLLEKKLVGRECKVITCGYEMPGWEAAVQEVVLGMQLNLYNWGSTEDEDTIFIGDDFLKEKPKELMQDVLSDNKFQGSNVIDHTGKYPIRGFNPNILNEEDSDEWTSDEDEEAEDENAEGSTDKRKPLVRVPGCSRSSK